MVLYAVDLLVKEEDQGWEPEPDTKMGSGFPSAF